MLCRWTDYDGNTRDMVSKSRAIPVTDGRFEFEIPADDDLYVLIPWNEFAVSSWYDCEFFAEKGKVRIEWGAEAPTAVKGGRMNGEKDAIAKPTRDVSDIYGPKLDAYYDMPGDAYMSDRAREIVAILETGPDPDSRDSLLKILYDLTDEERYTPEFYALMSEFEAKNMEATEATLQHAENDVRQGYLPFIIRLVKTINRWENRDDIMRVAAIYAERFADRPLGQRLAEYVRAQSTEVGGRYADFEAPDREGTMHRFSEMIEGSRIVLLDLWASWCGPCRRAAIRNKPIYERYRDRGFAVISVAREFDDTDDLDAAVAQDGYEWPVLVELDDRISLWRTYNAGDSGGLLVLIDPATGEILSRGPSAEEIERTVARYCDGQ
ncbi:MAG: TlpA family protein disulfide reductase [Alistipes sp.]|nr:TlpA family protein disulfide reductase [Alistipes sp.]